MRGQVIVEVLMILAMIMATILFIVAKGSEEVKSSTEIIREAQAEILARDIAQNLDFVYMQGEGAQISMDVKFPENFVPNMSYIGSPSGPGHVVNIHLSYPEGDIDVNERTDGKVYGKLPERAGYSKLNFKMYKDIALVGNPSSFASPSEINIIVEPEENRTEYSTLFINGEVDNPVEIFVIGEHHDWITPVEKHGGQIDIPLIKFPQSPIENSDYYIAGFFPGSKIVFGVQVYPPRFAEPGIYEMEIFIDGGDVNLTIPLNIELIREYQWLRINPPSWPKVPWENQYPYDIEPPIHGYFIICNEHKDDKYVEVVVDFDSDIFGLETGDYGVTGDYGECIYGNGRWYAYNVNDSGLVFTLLNNTSVLRYSKSTKKECRQEAIIRLVKGRECTGFQLDITLDGNTGKETITELFKSANNISSFPVNSSVYNISALTTKMGIPIQITAYGHSVVAGSMKIENTAKSILNFDFVCNVGEVPENITMIYC